MIEIKNVSKNYRKVKALDNVSITFHDNKIYGLLGRNGAGKSTLLNIMTDKIFSDSGEILLDGESISNNDKALSKLYLMNEKNFYPESMKVKDVFRWTKEFYPQFDMEEALRLSNLFKLNIKSNTKTLSTGYSSIFKAIVALCVNTPYILLDEPVLGLDANHRDLLYKIILEKYANNPCTIIISTHLIEEVASVVEDVVIIHHGKVLKNESCETLLSIGYSVTGTAAQVDEFIKNKTILGIDTLGGMKTAHIVGVNKSVPSYLEVSKLDLQKLFIQLTTDKEVI